MNRPTNEGFYTQEAEQLEDKLVTYVVELEGKVVVVEEVPARVNKETGEQFFSVDTMNRLQQLAEQHTQPVRYMATPVYKFAA